MDKLTCQKTMESKSIMHDYETCGRPAKFLIPLEHAFAKRQRVCGIHARQYNLYAKKMGWAEATPIEESE